MRVTAAGLPLETSISGKTGAGVWASASYLAACCMLQSPKLHGDVASAARTTGTTGHGKQQASSDVMDIDLDADDVDVDVETLSTSARGQRAESSDLTDLEDEETEDDGPRIAQPVVAPRLSKLPTARVPPSSAAVGTAVAAGASYATGPPSQPPLVRKRRPGLDPNEPGAIVLEEGKVLEGGTLATSDSPDDPCVEY